MSVGAESEELFGTQRARLLGLAYRMVGSIVDAEDIVAEAWVRWCATNRDEMVSAEAWLTTVTTRIAIDWLRSARHQRETYVGPWLPEPVLTEPGPEDKAELADSLTLGFLILLDRLDPVERAVFLMADVFSVPFEDIAAAVDKSGPACRQMASRARRKLRYAMHRPRPADRHLVDGLLAALGRSDLAAVLEHLAPDVVCVTDGGGARRAAPRPVIGAGRVARFLMNLNNRNRDRWSVSRVTVNAEPGIVVRRDGKIDFVAAFEVEGNAVRNIRLVRNPDKLRRLGCVPSLL